MENIGERSTAERERDLAEIASLYLRGWSQEAIREKFNVEKNYKLSRITIKNDIDEIHKRWKESYLVDYDSVKTAQLARIDNLENAYWDAFVRSQEAEKIDEVVMNNDYKTRGKMEPDYNKAKVTKRTKSRDGAVEFLKGVERCIQMRNKLYGIDAPKRLVVNWREEVKKVGMDEGVASEQFEELVNGFVRTLGRSDGDGGDAGSTPKNSHSKQG